MMILIFLLLSGCGSYIVIESGDYTVPVKIEKPDLREKVIRAEETSLGNYVDVEREFTMDRRLSSVFQSQVHFNVRDEFTEINKEKTPLLHTVIRTEFTFWDNLLALIPFYSRRTLTVRADYGEWDVKRIRVDDLDLGSDR